ncbi:UMP kinase [Oceanispirochaeta sp.]|uniref:UMP kinase n=1 Tax=Oceanispirochaeta sp. TaxID=2035350 RepID=UPI002603DAC9|nr:UMP kinase [Oceanispirochaeta sp.]MDA3957617.1 UMP kinase [Oceanispirochaeta sp.]
MDKIQILDLGGSIVAPEVIDTKFLQKMRNFLLSWLDEDEERRLILIIGGGAPARKYQTAFRETDSNSAEAELDWIGIMATRLNAQLMKAVMGSACQDPVVTDPTHIKSMKGRVLVAAGWKPGFSTDYDAVLLAENFKARTILNLSNIKKVYSADPNLDPDAIPLDSLSWEEYQQMCGHTWTPGKNTPFDPVATRKARDLKLKVIAADGRDLDNLKNIFYGLNFTGTVIGPE